TKNERPNAPNALELWNLVERRKVREFSGHLRSVKHVVFSPNGRQLLSGGSDKTVRVWDTDTGELVRTLTCSDEVTTLSVARSGGLVAAASGWAKATVQIWGPHGVTPLGALVGLGGPVIALDFSPDGRSLATAEESHGTSSPPPLRIWERERCRQT